MAKKLLYGLLFITLIALPLVAACAAPSGAPTKTLKVGLLAFLGWPIGLDMQHGVEIMVDLDNAAGGIDIGGEKYQVELIEYDWNYDQSAAQAAVNKLIYEDNVDFIVTECMFSDSVIPITEENKVIFITGVPGVQGIFDKNNKYCFHGAFMNTLSAEVIPWMASNLGIKSIITAYPDDLGGHGQADATQPAWEFWGVEATSEFYPRTTTDFSAVGTKVKNANPDAFGAIGGTADADLQAYKAVWQAGYRGQFLQTMPTPYLLFLTVVPPEAMEGRLVGSALPVEFDPAATPVAQEFKDAYIAKYGEWDGPEIVFTASYAALRAALEQAGSLDTDEVAAALNSGLIFEGPTGQGQMVSHEEAGISRTCDSITETWIKKIVDGKPTLLDKITLEEADGYIKKLWGQ